MSQAPSAPPPVAAGEDPPASLLEMGSGPSLLLLHGWGATKELMLPVAQRLPGFRVVVPDLPGFGDTGAPRQPWGVQDYAAWVVRLLDRIGIDSTSVIGHSNGGRVAIALAATYPKRVEKLVLTDSAGIRPRHSLRQRARVHSFKLLRILAEARWLPGVLRAAAKRRAGLRGSADYRAATGTMRGSMVRLVNEDLRSMLPSVAAPTLLIWGGLDTETPLSDGRLMESLLRDSGLVVFEGCGHFAYAEQPDRFGRVVDVFLRGPGQ